VALCSFAVSVRYHPRAFCQCFFFQAEDGIRDDLVTGVQTCARPISIASAVRNADAIVLQDLLRDVRDRVVVAITFLAMLELMKRREIVVEQAEPWGPIVARRTTPEEQAAAARVDDADIDESLESFA